jgi:arachidonate 15-lipoxygenase
VNRTLKIEIKNPNPLFSFYEATIKAYDGVNGPEASITMDFALLEQDPQTRADIGRRAEARRGLAIREFVDFVLERDGKRLEFEFTVERDIEELWKIIGNWDDVTWVQGAIAVDVGEGPPPMRTIKFPHGETFEVLTSLSEENKCLSYTVEKSAGMPVDLLKDTLRLSASQGNSRAGCSVVKSSVVLLPKQNLNADEIAAKLKASFEARFEWVRRTLAKPKAVSASDMYFGRLDTTKHILSNATSGVIDAPLSEVWALFRLFGKMETWWRDYLAGEISVEPGSKDVPVVGQIRAFKTISSRAYKEELEELNDVECRMVYSLSDMNPRVLTGAVTTIDFDPDTSDSNKTRVTWTSSFTLDDKYVSLASQISDGQKQVYDLGIRNLQQFFNKSKGSTLKVSVTAGSMIGTHCDCLLLSVGSGSVERIEISRNGAPKDSRQKRFSIVDMNDNLNVRVMDDRLLRDDCQVGFGSVELTKLLESSNCDLSIKDSSSNEIGRLTISVQLEQVSAPSASPGETLTKNLGKLAAVLGRELYNNVKAIAAGMSDDVNSKWQYGSYGDAFGPLPMYCKILPVSEAISPFRSGQLFQRFQEYIFSQFPLARALVDPAFGSQLLQSDLYAIILREYVQRPQKVIERWTHDDEVCAQMIRGVNPMKITAVTDKSILPVGFEDLKDDTGRGIDDLISEKALFYCDYFELMHGEYNDVEGYYSHQARLDAVGVNLGSRKYWYAPWLIMYKAKDSGTLSILGFQLTRHQSRPNETYTKSSHPPNVYQLAKLHLTCADNQHHQFATHLGLTHLLMEPFAVGLHNAFPVYGPGNPRTRHPIAKLLEVHFHDTVGINFLARQTLVSEVAPFTDATFSPGTKAAMMIFSSAYQRWDFIGSNFVNDLKSRGFDEHSTDGLSGYYYRDDGFKVWKAFETYVTSIVNELYLGDEDVAADVDLQAWCDEMTGPAGIKSFPKMFATKAELVVAVVSIMFYCSAQHAAVNFPQQRYVAYLPNRPDSLVSPMIAPANSETDISHEAIVKSFPAFANVEFQALFGHLLTCPPDNPFSVYSATEKEFPIQWKAFKDDLSAISRNIRARNKSLEDAGEIPYEYLDPEVIPQSINI